MENGSINCWFMCSRLACYAAYQTSLSVEESKEANRQSDEANRLKRFE